MFTGFGPGFGLGFGGFSTFGLTRFGPGFIPGFGFGGFRPGFGFGNFNGINAVGSAISTQSLINTGTATGINQISTPTAIW